MEINQKIKDVVLAVLLITVATLGYFTYSLSKKITQTETRLTNATSTKMAEFLAGTNEQGVSNFTVAVFQSLQFINKASQTGQ